MKDDDISQLDEFFPQKKINNKRKKNYNEFIGEKNELKLFQEKLLINRHNYPLNK